MKNPTSIRLVFLGFGLLVATGCGSRAESVCDQACECTGCNEDERQSCLDFAEDAELDAEQADCVAEYDELLACYDNNFECVGNLPTYNGCAGEAVNLLECEGSQTDG